MRTSRFFQLAVGAALLGAPVAFAQIVALDLRGMLERADSAIVGSIVEKSVWSGPLGSPNTTVEFTTLKVQGEDLVRGGEVTHLITFLGSETRPCSEMPTANETKVGTKGVFFSKKLNETWGGRADQWSMVAAQGGIFRVESGPKGDVVIGKGQGFAVSENRLMTELRTDVSRELAAIRRK